MSLHGLSQADPGEVLRLVAAAGSLALLAISALMLAGTTFLRARRAAVAVTIAALAQVIGALACLPVLAVTTTRFLETFGAAEGPMWWRFLCVACGGIIPVALAAALANLLILVGILRATSRETMTS